MSHARIFLMSLVAAAALAPAAAHAQHTATATFTPATTRNGTGLGMGAAATFNGGTSLLGTWGDDGGRFHVEGLFGLNRHGATDYELGARFWYHVHTAQAADFSLGGGLAMFSLRQGRNDRQYDFEIDLGAQARVFVASNVALLGTLGFGAYLPDTGTDTLTINGQLLGSFGFAYYFQ